jgi:hypothetical protein
MKLRTEHYLPAALGGAARGFGLNDEGELLGSRALQFCFL